MGKMKAHPRYNVISLRVCDDDHKFLERVSRLQKTSISDLMREALQHLISKPKDPEEIVHCRQRFDL